MRRIVDVTVSCTIEDPDLLIELARAEVDGIKPPDDRGYYYPNSPEDALMQIIRTAIANRLFDCEAVILHEIGHRARTA